MFRCFLLGVLLLSLSGNALALKDPTRPTGHRSVPGAVSQSLTLQSILFANSRRVAVINGRVLAEGEKLGDIRIIAINKTGVVISRGGSTQTLRLNTVSIRQEK